MRKLVWLAGMAGYLAFDLAVGSALPGPLVFVVLLVAVLLGGMVMGLIIGMAPRRYSPDTRYDRLKLLAAFFVAGLIGAVLGLILPLGIATWFPAGLIGLALLAFTFRLGSRQREAVEEPARDEA
jgi:MFS family permease